MRNRQSGIAGLALTAAIMVVASGCSKPEPDTSRLADMSVVSEHASDELTAGDVLLVSNPHGTFNQCTVGMFLEEGTPQDEDTMNPPAPKYLVVPKTCAPDRRTVSFSYAKPEDRALSTGKVTPLAIGRTDYANNPGGSTWTAVKIDYSELTGVPVRAFLGVNQFKSPTSENDFQEGSSRMCWMGAEQIPLCGTVTDVGPSNTVCAATETETNHYDAGAAAWLKEGSSDNDAPIGPVTSSEGGVVCAEMIGPDLVRTDLRVVG